MVYESGIVLDLITVFLLTTTTLMLGLSDRLNSEVLGTLLGGISGYVLGRGTQAMRPANAAPATRPTPSRDTPPLIEVDTPSPELTG